jgi:hypothetical protein
MQSACVDTGDLDVSASLRRAPIGIDIGARDVGQIGREFDADDLPERELEAISKTRPLPEPQSMKMHWSAGRGHARMTSANVSGAVAW